MTQPLPSRSLRSTALACAGGALLLMSFLGCTPALDWRETRAAGDGMVVLLPCKPERQVRELPLAGAPVAMELLACEADGSTWALTSADLGEAARVAPALEALRAARTRSLAGRELVAAPQPLRVASGEALRITVEGHRPDGSAVTEQSLLFARGTRVYQATVLGGMPTPEVLEMFFGGLRLP